jgi:hypothetical protein
LFVKPVSAVVDLNDLARRYAVSPSLVLGLGAGLYFEYIEQSHGTRARSISGMNSKVERVFCARRELYNMDIRRAVNEALRQNALNFNLDHAPSQALLGMEMLAEALPGWERHPDWRECMWEIARCIASTEGLYRGIYVEFLSHHADLLSDARLAEELGGIALEWKELAMQLERAISDPSELETSGRLVRRLAFREENFWGHVLDS